MDISSQSFNSFWNHALFLKKILFKVKVSKNIFINIMFGGVLRTTHLVSKEEESKCRWFIGWFHMKVWIGRRQDRILLTHKKTSLPGPGKTFFRVNKINFHHYKLILPDKWTFSGKKITGQKLLSQWHFHSLLNPSTASLFFILSTQKSRWESS